MFFSSQNIDADTLRNELITLLQRSEEKDQGPFWKRLFGSGKPGKAAALPGKSEEVLPEAAGEEGQS